MDVSFCAGRRVVDIYQTANGFRDRGIYTRVSREDKTKLINERLSRCMGSMGTERMISEAIGIYSPGSRGASDLDI